MLYIILILRTSRFQICNRWNCGGISWAGQPKFQLRGPSPFSKFLAVPLKLDPPLLLITTAPSVFDLIALKGAVVHNRGCVRTSSSGSCEPVDFQKLCWWICGFLEPRLGKPFEFKINLNFLRTSEPVDWNS